MRKLLLTAAAAMACAFGSSAQIYTAQASFDDPEWDTPIIDLHKTVAVDVYEDYVIVKGWLDNPEQDLKVTWDADQNLTSVTPITNGVAGDTTTDGWASFATGNPSMYWVQLYIGSTYGYAISNEYGGYVCQSGYFYTSSTESVWAVYYITWDYVESELYFETSASAKVYEDFEDSDMIAFIPPTPVDVKAYSDHIVLDNFCYEGNGLSIAYNDEAAVTSITRLDNGEAQESTTGRIEVKTAMEDYPVAVISPELSYAYASASDGYVLLMGTLGDGSGNYYPMYYYVPFDKESTGISSITEENAPVEYYDLMGRRVVNPASGQILIQRQGNKVTKTVFR